MEGCSSKALTATSHVDEGNEYDEGEDDEGADAKEDLGEGTQVGLFERSQYGRDYAVIYVLKEPLKELTSLENQYRRRWRRRAVQDLQHWLGLESNRSNRLTETEVDSRG